MVNKIKTLMDEFKLYAAKISTGWAILSKGRVIKIFDTKQELSNFWEDNAITIKGEYYELEIKNPPLPKIGDVFFEHKWFEYLRMENFIIETDKIKINLITKTGDIIAVFDSQMEFENWQPKYIKWKNKKSKNPGFISTVKMEASKENSIRKNFISTDNYNHMQDDSDWWREQS